MTASSIVRPLKPFGFSTLKVKPLIVSALSNCTRSVPDRLLQVSCEPLCVLLTCFAPIEGRHTAIGFDGPNSFDRAAVFVLTCTAPIEVMHTARGLNVSINQFVLLYVHCTYRNYGTPNGFVTYLQKHKYSFEILPLIKAITGSPSSCWAEGRVYVGESQSVYDRVVLGSCSS